MALTQVRDVAEPRNRCLHLLSCCGPSGGMVVVARWWWHGGGGTVALLSCPQSLLFAVTLILRCSSSRESQVSAIHLRVDKLILETNCM